MWRTGSSRSPRVRWACQELKCRDEDFPLEDFEDLGYRCLVHGQKTYNGVALLTRDDVSEPVTGIPGLDDPQARGRSRRTVGGVRVINLYVPNGKEVGHDHYHYKLRWLDALTEWVRAELKRWPRLAVMGDFNIAPDDRDVHDPEEWRDKILCSAPERDRLRALEDLGLKDSSACSISPKRRSVGGTTGRPRSGATAVFASTWSCSRRRWAPHAQRPASTRRRANSNARPITPPSSLASPANPSRLLGSTRCAELSSAPSFRRRHPGSILAVPAPTLLKEGAEESSQRRSASPSTAPAKALCSSPSSWERWSRDSENRASERRYPGANSVSNEEGDEQRARKQEEGWA